jgi:hypothetical protein
MPAARGAGQFAFDEELVLGVGVGILDLRKIKLQ